MPMRFRIRQILDNLVSNAIKYTDRGSVTIQAQVSEILGKPTLTLSVKDTGKGMTDEEKQKRVPGVYQIEERPGHRGNRFGIVHHPGTGFAAWRRNHPPLYPGQRFYAS